MKLRDRTRSPRHRAQQAKQIAKTGRAQAKCTRGSTRGVRTASARGQNRSSERCAA